MSLLNKYIQFIDRCIISRRAGPFLFGIPLAIFILSLRVMVGFNVSQRWFDVVSWIVGPVGVIHLLFFILRRAVFIPEDHPSYIEKAPKLDGTLADRAGVSLRMIKDVLK